MWTQKERAYAKNIAIVTLSGGLLGTLLGQFVSEPATMGKSLLGTFLGAAIVGSGYGLYLRTGGDNAKMLGLQPARLYPRRVPVQQSSDTIPYMEGAPSSYIDI